MSTAVVDASVIFLVTHPQSKTESNRAARSAQASKSIRELEADGVRLVIPAIVEAELDAAAASAQPHFTGLMSLPFDRQAARLAAPLVQAALRRRREQKSQPGAEAGTITSRDVVKYDLLIVASAAAVNAKYILTANGGDIRRYCLDAEMILGKKIEVLDVDRQLSASGLQLPLPV